MVSLLLATPFALLALFYVVKPLRPALADRGLVLALCVTPVALAVGIEIAEAAGLFRWVLLALASMLGVVALAGTNAVPLLTHLMEAWFDEKD